MILKFVSFRHLLVYLYDMLENAQFCFDLEFENSASTKMEVQNISVQQILDITFSEILKDPHILQNIVLTLLHSERPKLHRVLAVLSAIGLTHFLFYIHFNFFYLKLLISQNKFSGTRKLTLRYQKFSMNFDFEILRFNYICKISITKCLCKRFIR